ncbi:LANO_0A03840g1_1 [Lachancea nothofagi CBS 11611]|uniref:Kinase n=1 Tax=Lachancea nothofagi CBS 11611 TaxID=1266666 RepID=A0A1G4IPS8_9SACH|nr:LANO_0A03840g1_1 [Lachancea nothofagi CBS 11611]
MKPTAKDNKQDELNDVAKHLKDLNVFDKRKMPPVIHGRKASTYLRVFQDDENGHRHNNVDDKAQHDNTCDPKELHHAWRLPNFGKKGESRIALPRRHSSSVYDGISRFRQGFNRDKFANPAHSRKPGRFTKKCPVTSSTRRYPINKSTDEAQLLQDPPATITEFVPLQTEPKSQPSEAGAIPDERDKLLPLKPISSATYYPHQTKSELLDDPVTTKPMARSAPIVPQVQVMKKRPNTEAIESSKPVESLAKTKEALASIKRDEIDEHKPDDEVYPLAVELQPFTNKVGGHTAIFRFSERAVCKALVSRENMWYENIEQQHKELLDFIPRYIGVLNVRQHFNSKEEFLREVEREKRAKLAKKQQKLDAISSTGPSGNQPQNTHSSSPPLELKNPEVVLDDNKHIIPDSLWYKYSHSPESAPSDSYLSSHSLEDRAPRFGDSGSTVINTKLQELILKEVFAPTKRKSHNRVSSLNDKLGSKGSISSTNLVALNNSVRRNSDEFKGAGVLPPSPLLDKSTKAILANAIDSHSSVLDLKQFHMRKMAKIDADNQISSEGVESQEDSIPPPNSFGDDYRDPAEEEDGIFTMEEDLPRPKEEPNHESISFEENSHTIVSKFILLEDLTRKLDKPCVLDLKMGTRQYGVDANKFKHLSQSKKCRQTTSRKLGVRICGLKIWNKDYYIKRDKYFGRRVQIGWQFARVFARFLYNGKDISSILRQIPQLIAQLDKLYAEILKLKGYRLYGSSLLLIYDGNDPENRRCSVKVNLIDFAQCVTRDDILKSYDTFRIPPKSPETEDKGFLRGVRSLKFYLLSVWNYLTNDSPLLYDEDLARYIEDNLDTLEKPWDWLDNFDDESEFEFDNPESELRKKWRKYELIFDLEPRYIDDGDVSE